MFNITEYMFNCLRGNNISNYITSDIKQDIRLKYFLTINPVPNADIALNYLNSRISCLGQVIDIQNYSEHHKGQTLRSFIETTKYKDKDYTDSKNFLYIISQIEKNYIISNYQPLIQEFKKHSNPNLDTIEK